MPLITRLAMLFLVLAATAQAQVSEKITVNYVEIPVTVVDRDGAPIRGLKAENFEVVSEGKPRSVGSLDVTDFGSADSGSANSVTATSPLNPIARRNFLILFDLSYSSPIKIVKAEAAANDFVTKMVHPRDRVAVATIDVAHGFRLLSAFTTDRTLVSAAIANPRTFHGFDPLQLAGESAFVTQSDLPDTPGNTDKFAEDFKDVLRGADRLEDQYNRDKIDKQVGMLTGLATTLRAVSGRKHIVFLSEGFDSRLIQGRDAHLTQDQVREAAAVESGQIWNIPDTDNRYGSSTSLTILAKLTEAARKSDVILDAVDISGIRSQISAKGGTTGPASNEGLHLLANATGGTVIKNSNDLTGDFSRELKMQEVVYVLGFTAPTAQPGSFHPISVRLVNVPGGHLSYRAGYYESGQGNEMERSLSNAEIIMNDIPQEAIHLASLAAPFPTAKANAQVPVILEINGGDLLAAARDQHATTDIFIYAFDHEGIVRDALYQSVALDLSKVGDKIRNNGVKYYATLSLPAGSYAIKTLVHVRESGRNGFKRNDVLVPASSDLAVSQPFFFEDAGQWLTIKGGSHDTTNAAYPFQMNGEPFIPSASARLRTGGPRKFVLFVRNAAPDDLLFGSFPKTTVVSVLKSSEGTKVVLELPPDSEKASALNVTVRKRGDADQRTATIPLLYQ
jgi:VWFA-related protein